MTYRKRHPAAVLAIAFLAVAVVTAFKLPFPLVGVQKPFLGFFAAVTVTAWYGGMAGGLVATALAVLAATFFFVGRPYSFEGDFHDYIPVLIFTGECVLISYLSGLLHFARRRAERNRHAVEDSERQNRLMVENVRDYALFMTDTTGVVTKWNIGAERVLGWPEDEIVGKSSSVIFTPEDRAAGVDVQETATSQRDGHAAAERWHLRKDGSRFFGSGMMMRLDDEAGRHLGFTRVLRDMTAQREAEQELAEARAQTLAVVEAERNQLAAVIKLAPSFMAVLRGPQHVFELVNDRYLDVIGHRDVAGKGIRQALPEIEGQGFYEILDRVYATGEPYVGTDVRVMLQRVPGGPLEERFVDFVNQATRHTDGTISGVFVHGIDLTSRKEAEHEREQLLASERAARSEAERAGRMKDEFLATLSHELRTPLNAILGWSQILRAKDGSPSADDLREGLGAIERNTRAQTQIIEDLLDMSRIVSGRVRLNVERLDLTTTVQAGVDTMRPAADAKGVRLTAVLGTEGMTISGDPNRLQQVFWNLIANAVKFTPKGGEVRVLLGRVASHVEIAVADTGEGISPEFLPHVFDRFRQADASTTRRHGGLGLGLSIVKQLVELHGGTVRAESAGRGSGTTFRVGLPLLAVSPEPQPEARQPDFPANALAYQHGCASTRLDGVKVLVVDDEADARAIIRRILEECGAVVSSAASASEALELFRAGRPDVVLSDIGMPGEDGYTLVRRLRELPKVEGGGTPTLALTAYARPEDRVRAVRAGFNMHVVKPVEPVELVTMVASLAGRSGE